MVDRRGVLEKIMNFVGLGNDSAPVEFDSTDLMKATESGFGLLPGIGQIGSPILAAPSTAMEIRRNQEWVQENFGVGSFEQQAQLDPLFKKELEAVDGLITKAVATSAAGAVGGAAGGAAGMWAGAQMAATLGAFLGPVGATLLGGAGFLVGAFAGGTAASYPVDYILAKPRTDAFAVIGHIQEDIKSGAGIDPRKVFVNLAASLPDEVLAKNSETGKNIIERKLAILSGGKIKSLQEALEKQPEIIDALIADTDIDNTIKTFNGMLVIGDITDKSGQFTAKTATQLFTEQLEAGVDPRILVLRQKRMQLVEQMNMEVLQESVGPETMAPAETSHDMPVKASAHKRHKGHVPY